MSTFYQDHLIKLTDTEITFYNYSFPSGEARSTKWSEVESVQMVTPTLSNGQYRIWGSGNLRTWFPNDRHRPKRDWIFLVRLRQTSERISPISKLLNSLTGRGYRSIGFTAQDSQKVAAILKDKGFLDRIPNLPA